MLDLWRSAYLIVGCSILFVPSNQIGSNQFIPKVPQYTDNSLPDDGAQNFPVIQLNLGYIKGSWMTSAQGRKYAAYKGVPYAAPPLGNLRFEPPQERKGWSGVRNALKHGSQCPQLLFVVNKFIGSEDCLYLNIYVPQPNRSNPPRNSRDKLLPILFFIHGGAWCLGAGDMDNYLYGPDRFMDKEVIVVTINYRLGAMGFLHLENTVPGNMGLKDQAMALKMIRANAKSLGGDPDRITIMGESAGAASAEFHLMNPESKKMIFGAISQSGSVLSPWAWTRPDVLAARTRRLAKFVRCPANAAPRYLINCLKRVNPREIVRFQLLTDWSPRQIPIGISFTPTIEPPGTPNAFMLDCPRNMLVRLRETPQTIPYIVGYNTMEGQIFTKIAAGMLDGILQAGARMTLGLPRQSETADSIRRKSYVQQTSLSMLDQIIGDYEFKTPIIDSSRYHSNAGSNVYLYHFTFTGRNNFVKLFWNAKAPTHMDELTYLFQGRGLFGELPRIEKSTPEAAVSERLLRMWTDFAKTGNPTPVKNNTGVDTYWPQGPSKILIIGKELTVGNSPLQTGWSDLINKQCFL